jgi:hypothetical protein
MRHVTAYMAPPWAARHVPFKPLASAALELFEPLVAAAIPAVEFIFQLVLLVILLVVILGRIKLARRGDLGDYRPRIKALRHRRLGGLGCLLLLIDQVENRRADLRDRVAELSVRGERIDVAPEILEQVLVSHLQRIEDDAHDLNMAGHDLLVSGVRHMATDIARGGRDDAGTLSKSASVHQKQPPPIMAVACEGWA